MLKTKFSIGDKVRDKEYKRPFVITEIKTHETKDDYSIEYKNELDLIDSWLEEWEIELLLET